MTLEEASSWGCTTLRTMIPINNKGPNQMIKVQLTEYLSNDKGPAHWIPSMYAFLYQSIYIQKTRRTCHGSKDWICFACPLGRLIEGTEWCALLPQLAITYFWTSYFSCLVNQVRILCFQELFGASSPFPVSIFLCFVLFLWCKERDTSIKQIEAKTTN